MSWSLHRVKKHLSFSSWSLFVSSCVFPSLVISTSSAMTHTDQASPGTPAWDSFERLVLGLCLSAFLANGAIQIRWWKCWGSSTGPMCQNPCLTSQTVNDFALDSSGRMTSVAGGGKWNFSARSSGFGSSALGPWLSIWFCHWDHALLCFSPQVWWFLFSPGFSIPLWVVSLWRPALCASTVLLEALCCLFQYYCHRPIIHLP